MLPLRLARVLVLLTLWVSCGPSGTRRDDAVVVLLPREPEQLDPRYVGDAYGLKLSRLLHASLVKIDPHSLAVGFDLAERVEVVDPLHVHVTVRPGLHFADGSVLDAEDVVATFRALTDPRVKSRVASTFARIAEVYAENPLAVMFTLKAAHATFVTDLEMPVLRAEDAFVPAAAGRTLVGAGPYLLASRAPGELELTANPLWHGGMPPYPHVRFVVIHDDNTRALRLLGNAADLALNTIPPMLVPLFEQRPDFSVRTAPGVGTTYLGVNLTHPQLRDPRVRRAIAYAIDRASIVRYKLGGRARLAASFIPPGHWAHEPASNGSPYAPDKARALLDVAGLVPRADGTRLSLTLRTSSDRSVVSIARAMVGMLREVGIDVEVRPSEGATLLADLARGRFELTFLQIPEVFEPHVLSWFFGSDHIPEPGVHEGANRWRLRSSALDAALERGRLTSVQSERIAAYLEAQRILAAELPVIPLWHEDVVSVTSQRLRNYRVPRDARFGTLTR